MHRLCVVRRTLLLLSLVLLTNVISAQEKQPLPLGFNLTPYASLPLGADAKTFSVGGGAQGAVDYTFPQWPLFSVGGVADYLYVATPDPSASVSILAAGGLTSLGVNILPILSVRGHAAGGWFYGFRNSPPPQSGMATSGQAPWLEGGLGLGLNLSEYFSLNLDASYRNNLGLYTAAQFSLMGRLTPAGQTPFIHDAVLPEGYLPLLKEKRGLKLLGLKVEQIFPVFKNYYDEHPLASVIIHNFDASPATDVQVTAEFKGYTDSPRNLKVPATLGPGATLAVDVHTLFNDRILSVAEASKLGLTLTLRYTQKGYTATETYAPSVDVLYRNAITWDDDRHVAAFVSSRDPAAYGFARGLLSATRDHRNRALASSLETAMIVHEALKRHGLIYSKVPTSAFNRGDKVTVDTVQFPQETLVSKAGDCSDLTVLWCSILESVGIETAVITTPGHIYMAFALDVTPEQAVAVLGPKDKFLFRNGKVWVPVETTMITDSFMNAWKEGARESDPSLQPNLAFYPIHDAWKVYAPVVVNGTATAPALPAASALVDALDTERALLMKLELEPRVSRLLADMKTSANPTKAANSLGLLYARYGLYDKAVQVLGDLTANQTYGPAFVNLGNVLLLQKQYENALAKFGRWLDVNPDEALAVAGQALAYDGLGDRAHAQESLVRLSVLDVNLAKRYSYLSGGSEGDTRAAEAHQLEDVLSWKE